LKKGITIFLATSRTGNLTDTLNGFKAFFIYLFFSEFALLWRNLTLNSLSV